MSAGAGGGGGGGNIACSTCRTSRPTSLIIASRTGLPVGGMSRLISAMPPCGGVKCDAARGRRQLRLVRALRRGEASHHVRHDAVRLSTPSQEDDGQILR